MIEIDKDDIETILLLLNKAMRCEDNDVFGIWNNTAVDMISLLEVKLEDYTKRI